MKKKNKINFKQKKYILPLILLPFILFIGINLSGFIIKEEIVEEEVSEINVSLTSSKTTGEIKEKKEAYSDWYNTRNLEARSRIDNIEIEVDEENFLESNYDDSTKKLIDSLDLIKAKHAEELAKLETERLKEQNSHEKLITEKELTDSEILQRLANQNNTQKEILNEKKNELERDSEWNLENIEKSQMRMLREQTAFLDSIEKANDPNIQRQYEAEQRLKQHQEAYEEFLNSRLPVTKERSHSAFNSVYKENKNEFVKAVIDEDIKGYLGSRIRIRLLEPIYVGDTKLEKGTFMYAQISGFKLQRVELSIVSVMHQNQILPINLNIYDNDGMKGLYVPASVFREMTREMGQSTVQGQNLSMTDNSFYTNSINQLFSSTSRAITSLIRKNKAKIKYNTFVYLIDESTLK